MEPGVLFSGAAREAVLRQYHSLLGVQWLHERNPCPQPVSLERKDMHALLSGDYVVADKSDGVRFTLFLTEVDDQAYSVLIDRKLSLYQVPVAASRGVYRGSIFDGELVWVAQPDGTRTHCFLVFDIAAFRGSRDIAKCGLMRRLEAIRGAFDLEGHVVTSPEVAARLARAGKIVCGGSRHGLCFRAKQCFRLADLDVLLRQIPTLPYPVDGLVFTPVDRPVGHGTHERLFKLKLRHTVDLEVGEAGELLVGLGGGPATAVQRISLESLGLGISQGSALREKLAALRDAVASGIPVIVECELLDPASPRLGPPKLRGDKAHPNAIRTVVATLTNLREDIRPEELARHTLLRANDAELALRGGLTPSSGLSSVAAVPP